jgi:hypothetical protein
VTWASAKSGTVVETTKNARSVPGSVEDVDDLLGRAAAEPGDLHDLHLGGQVMPR